MKTWAERIRDLQAAGMTLSAIGEAIELTTGAVGDIASGRTESPRGNAALKLDQLHRARCESQPNAAA